MRMRQRRSIEKLKFFRLFGQPGAEEQKRKEIGDLSEKILEMNKNNHRILEIQRLFLGET